MLENLITPPTDPHRVVVIGASGFVGKACSDLLETRNVPLLRLGRAEIDLLAEGAVRALADRLLPDDSVVVVSARAPCKDAAMLRDNIAMMETVCAALGEHPVRHVVYISSDAVYGDEPVPLTEASPTAPGSMHGVMYLTREIMLRECVPDTLAVLRPTLIYGAEDPHNGYGPNRFRRLAADGEDIVLFGEGEERRDHVLVDDVAELVVRMLRSSNTGTLNAATGQVTSFRNIAETIASMFDTGTVVKSSPRVGQMPHNGYRPFDPAATAAAFPDFAYTPLGAGLKQVHSQTVKTENG